MIGFFPQKNEAMTEYHESVEIAYHFFPSLDQLPHPVHMEFHREPAHQNLCEKVINI